MDDTIKKLGTVRDKDEGRDAIHIAVLTMQNQGFIVNGTTAMDKNANIVAFSDPRAIGIVDPFLPQGTAIKPGQWFYVYLKPASITGLRHVWSHPEFPDTPSTPTVVYIPPIDEAVARVKQFVAHVDAPIDYDEFLEVLQTGEAGQFRLDRGTIRCGGSDAYGEIPDEILRDVELIIGMKLINRPSYFSCSC